MADYAQQQELSEVYSTGLETLFKSVLGSFQRLSDSNIHVLQTQIYCYKASTDINCSVKKMAL
jgi:hypothetical protein